MCRNKEPKTRKFKELLKNNFGNFTILSNLSFKYSYSFYLLLIFSLTFYRISFFIQKILLGISGHKIYLKPIFSIYIVDFSILIINLHKVLKIDFQGTPEELQTYSSQTFECFR